MKKIKPTDWRCIVCGADCSFGVFAIIKGQPHCLKCFRKYRKKPEGGYNGRRNLPSKGKGTGPLV